MDSDLLECLAHRASKQGFKLYIFVKRVKSNGKTYYYLVIQEYDPPNQKEEDDTAPEP